MIIENEKAKAEANAKVIADMDKAQVSFLDRVGRIKGDSKNDKL